MILMDRALDGVRLNVAILRHADFSITMEVYSQASSAATRDALRRLGESLG